MGKLIRRLLQLILGAIALIGITGFFMNKYAPENFFEGRDLEAAQAIKQGKNAQLPALLSGLDLNKPGKKQMTLLWFAIQEKNFEAIKIIVRGGRTGQTRCAGLGNRSLLRVAK
jgi:uncharacterized protein